ncbi:MAG: sigma-70 family RNA polymerase sigma factor [Actinomycetota bacterium]|nr:sigma-70 family RNA polymerase sigma factor [Actinomycetota bacterium]
MAEQYDVSERPGNADGFPEVAEGYRRELMAHCYRMTGSVSDAEDLVQETYLRAWRAYDGFEGRSTVRTWLHRIATNVCLTALEGKQRRPMPTGLGTSDARPADELVESREVPWLEPVPDSAVEPGNVDPATVVANRDTIRLAFVAALQHLPARQRAVLILRDVLRWRASEVAEALGTTTVAVNSALQRAHARLAEESPRETTVTDDLTSDQRTLLDRYVSAFWEKDVTALVGLLTCDAVWEMPPFTSWYVGAETIGELVATQCPGGCHDMPMIETTANGQPAFGLYMRTADGHFEPWQIQVLSLKNDRVDHVAAFFDTALFPKFGLPAQLPASYSG